MLAKAIAWLYSKPTERSEFSLYSDLSKSYMWPTRQIQAYWKFGVLDANDGGMRSFKRCHYQQSPPNAVINVCPKRVIGAVTCRLLDPEHTLSRDIPLDIQQDLFLLLLPGQANSVDLLVSTVVSNILACSQLYLDVRSRYINGHFICHII